MKLLAVSGSALNKLLMFMHFFFFLNIKSHVLPELVFGDSLSMCPILSNL